MLLLPALQRLSSSTTHCPEHWLQDSKWLGSINLLLLSTCVLGKNFLLVLGSHIVMSRGNSWLISGVPQPAGLRDNEVPGIILGLPHAKSALPAYKISFQKDIIISEKHKVSTLLVSHYLVLWLFLVIVPMNLSSLWLLYLLLYLLHWCPLFLSLSLPRLLSTECRLCFPIWNSFFKYNLRMTTTCWAFTFWPFKISIKHISLDLFLYRNIFLFTCVIFFRAKQLQVKNVVFKSINIPQFCFP